MGYLIGIQIPDELRTDITSFCRRHHYALVEPHITLISAELLEGIDGIEQKLQAFCLSQADFKTIVAGPNTFENKILYLTVLPGVINFMREKLVKQLKIPPDKKVYRPHVTIVRQTPGRETIDMSQMLQDARQVFTRPMSFTVQAATLYSQPQDRTPFKPIATMQFSGR